MKPKYIYTHTFENQKKKKISARHRRNWQGEWSFSALIVTFCNQYEYELHSKFHFEVIFLRQSLREIIREFAALRRKKNALGQMKAFPFCFALAVFSNKSMGKKSMLSGENENFMMA